MRNSLGREVPEALDGRRLGPPYNGALDHPGQVTKAPVRFRAAIPGRSKILPTIRRAIEACELRDGATISFHHHLRDGDGVLNMVLAEAARMGLRDLRIASSSLFPVHAPLVEHFRRGIVSRIDATYIAGPIGEAISRGQLPTAAVMYTHGGRARAIESGELHVDVAFVAAPTADDYGNLNGTGGPSACGVLGYAAVDSVCAEHVVAISDNLVPYPACPIDITQDNVDYVVPVDSIGDSRRIESGSLRAVADPIGLSIAEQAAAVIASSGLLVDGFAFQTGAGGISLEVARCLADLMRKRGIEGSFASGGITGRIVQMLERGQFRALLDVQCFDLEAVDSYRRDPRHIGISASTYANPHNRGAVVNRLDAVVLGAAEVDAEFNVNVTTGSHGVIIGGSGGHADTAAGAKLAIVTTRLTGGGYAKLVESVRTITTPGETVDVVVCEAGVAVNPRRPDVAERLREADLPVVGIDELIDRAARMAVRSPAPLAEGRTVAVVQYRDGTILDVVRQAEA